jgi:hypothetical protein
VSINEATPWEIVEDASRPLGERIEAIAGDGGWEKSGSQKVYERAAGKLVQLGMSETEAVNFLDDLYLAAVECYGGP